MDDRFAMKRLGRKSGFRWLAVLVSVGLLLSGLAKSSEPHPAAVAFGSFPQAWGARISPDGKRIVFLSMHESDLPIALVYDIDKKAVNLVAASQKDEFELKSCVWANSNRLLCSFYSIHQARSFLYPVTRLVGVNADGTQMKVLLQNRLAKERHVAQFQDKIIDLLPDEPTRILIAIPNREGLGVAHLDIYSGSVRKEERPHPTVRDWISDGEGNIRVRMKMNERNIEWQGRAYESSKWKSLHKHKITDLSHYYEPLGFGERTDELLVMKLHEGRVALWAENLDAEVPDRLIFSHPEVDLAGVWVKRTGMKQRLVGVGYVTDRLYYHFFDDRMQEIHELIAPIFPNQVVTVFDESWGSQFYLVGVASDTTPGTIYVFDSKKKELHRWTDQYPALKGRSLASMKSLQYPARDGTLIPAYLTEPIKKKEGPRPTVILPHGGPHARDVWGYDWLVQYLAARGYLVLQMNYRGSSGWGQDWLGEGGFRDWRTTLNDITDGARYLVETGQADPDRMCIVGWSYGGYAALLSGIEEPDLYRCVVSVAGVSDLEDLIAEQKKFVGGRSMQEYIGRNKNALRAGSPARRAKEMGPPTLLFHGEEDINVRIKQSKKMNKALKKADKEVTFIEYEEVEHSLLRNAIRIDMLDRMGEFLDTHTQPLPPPSPQNE